MQFMLMSECIYTRKKSEKINAVEEEMLLKKRERMGTSGRLILLSIHWTGQAARLHLH